MFLEAHQHTQIKPILFQHTLKDNNMTKNKTTPKTEQNYQDELIKWFSPYGLVIENHHNVNRICGEMIKTGYTTEKIYQLVDFARAYWNLEKLERKTK
jgi:hypothetical protein